MANKKLEDRIKRTAEIEKWWNNLPPSAKYTFIERWRTDDFYKIYFFETVSLL